MEQECGCVMYYMPRLNQNGKICTRANFDCYNPLRISLERGENAKYQCSCYPACDSLSFSGDVSAAPLIPPHLNAKSSLANFSIESIRYEKKTSPEFGAEYVLFPLKGFSIKRVSMCRFCLILSYKFRSDIAIVEIYYNTFAFETFVRDEFIGFTEFLCM